MGTYANIKRKNVHKNNRVIKQYRILHIPLDIRVKLVADTVFTDDEQSFHMFIF